MSSAHHDLLFGLLALQNGLIDQVQLVAAFQGWTRDKSRPLAEHLVARGDLDAEQRAGIGAMVALHLKKHGGDAERSLAAIPAGRSTRENLARLGDPAIDATLARAGAAAGSGGSPAADRTATYSVGSVTADGQRFRVLRPHANGGLGAVFVALDNELHREVALKQINDRHADDPTSRQRFLLEAEITGGLEHPGIVPVYGLGAYGDGRPFYAMRFIKGDSLKEAVERFHADAELKSDPGRRSLALHKLLRRFLDVCNAVEYAHSRGVLHRDIKPGNVIVGKHGETLVVDWGLAKSLGRVEPGADFGERPLTPSSASGSAETLPGSVLGTPAYMSPEQAAGAIEHLGPQSDVYSLGATLYCLLTGKAPFEGEVGEVLRAVQKGRFAPPRRVDPTIDRGLEAVCLKAMATKHGDRYPSCRALAEDVERWTADEPVTAWREPLSRRARRWARRNRTAVTAAAALLLTAVVALLVGTVLINRERVRAEANFRQARAAVDEYFTKVSESKLLEVPGLQPLRKDLLESARKYYEDFLRQRGDDPGVRAEAAATSYRLAMLTQLVGSKAAAVALFEKAHDFYEGLVRAYPGVTRFQCDLAICCNDLANLHRLTGRANEALSTHRRALEIRERMAHAHPRGARFQNELAKSHASLGKLHVNAGRMPEAREHFKKALAIDEQVAADPNPDLDFPTDLGKRYNSRAALMNDLARGYLMISYSQFAAGETTESLRSREQASAIAMKLVRDHPADLEQKALLATCHTDVAVMLDHVGRPEASLRAFQEGRDVLEAMVEANPTIWDHRKHLAETYKNLARSLLALGRPAEALDYAGKGHALIEGLVAENPSITWFRFVLAENDRSLAALFLSLGRMADAQHHLETCRATLEKLVADDPSILDFRSSLAGAHDELGNLLARNGQPEAALRSYEAAQMIREALVTESSSVTNLQQGLATTYNNLGRLKRDVGRLDEAVGSYRKAHAILEKLAGDHPDVYHYQNTLGYTCRGLARVSAQLGRADEAQGWLNQAAAIDQRFADTYPLSRYNLACDLALGVPLVGQSGGGRDDAAAARSRERAGRAMEALRRAIAQGYTFSAIISRDADLDSLRPRPDFHLLMLDLTFPADPFAPGR
jgi:eukaryotic-like serine/threonine-protein kinase